MGNGESMRSGVRNQVNNRHVGGVDRECRGRAGIHTVWGEVQPLHLGSTAAINSVGRGCPWVRKLFRRSSEGYGGAQGCGRALCL